MPHGNASLIMVKDYLEHGVVKDLDKRGAFFTSFSIAVAHTITPAIGRE